MNKKVVGLVIAVFVLVAVITLLVIGLSGPKTNTADTPQPQNNTQNVASVENSVDPIAPSGSSNSESAPPAAQAEEVINVKTDRAEFNFYISRTDKGFYMDIERVSDDGYRTGYYITGLPNGHFYSTREIIDPEKSDAKDFYLPNTYMNEGIVFGGSTPKDHAACFINMDKGSSPESAHSDLTVRAVNIDLGTLIDVLDMTIDFDFSSNYANIRVETADAYVKGEVDDEIKTQMTWLAVDNARRLFPDINLDETWQKYVFKTVLIDLAPYPYHANVYETESNIPYFMVSKWPGTYGHVYAVNIYLNYYGYMTVYMDEGAYLRSQAPITDPNSIIDTYIVDFAYSPVCTRDANSVVPVTHKPASADSLLRRY